jgi:hypothetical protein
MQQRQMADMMRNQMMMTMGMSMGMSRNPIYSFIGLSLYDKIVASYPKWWPYIQELFCQRKRLEPSTPPHQLTNQFVPQLSVNAF